MTALHAQGEAHNDLALGHANAVGLAADREVGRLWARLLTVLRAPGSYHDNYVRTLAILKQVQPAVLETLRHRLGGIALWSQRRTARGLVRHLPVRVLRHAAVQRVGLLEDTEADRDDARDLFQSMLFPAPSRDRVLSILDTLLPARDWLNFMGDQDQATPLTLAQRIANGISQGQSNQEVARAIRPYFDGSRTRAMRSARTYGLYVANHMQLDTYEQLGADLVIGYQVHSAGGHNARHNHLLRSGTIYYRDPKGDQRGFDRMPQPPWDKDDPPFTTAGLSWNCRCWLTPMLAETTAHRESSALALAHA